MSTRPPFLTVIPGGGQTNAEIPELRLGTVLDVSCLTGSLLDFAVRRATKAQLRVIITRALKDEFTDT